MAEKILNTRIQLKYDTYQNWTDDEIMHKGANLVLKKGEVGFCEVPTGSSAATNAPTVLFKVGDGEHTFGQLKWASALAADVYEWAKKTEAEFKDWAKNLVPIEVIDNQTGKFVTDVTATNDANGHHITITRANVDWADLTGTSPIGDGDLTITIGEGLEGDEIDTSMNSSNDAITIIKHGAQPTEGTNATAVAGERTDNTFVSNVVIDKFGHVAKVETKNAFFADNDTITKVESADKYIKVETAQPQFMADEENIFKVSLVESELKALIGAETTAAMEFKGATASLPTGTLNKGDMYKVTASFEVTEAQDAQGVGFTTQIGDSIVYEGAKWYWIPSGDDIEDTWRPVVVNELAVGSDATLEINSGTENTTLYGEFEVNQQKVKTNLVIPNADDETLGLVRLGIAGGAEEYGAAAALVNALDVADKTGDFVTKVVQTNGKIEVTKANYGDSYLEIATTQDDGSYLLETEIRNYGNNQLGIGDESNQVKITKLAQTANVNDLVQTEGDIIVFNCGTSTTVLGVLPS